MVDFRVNLSLLPELRKLLLEKVQTRSNKASPLSGVITVNSTFKGIIIFFSDVKLL